MRNKLLLLSIILSVNFFGFGQYESYNLPSFNNPSPNAYSLSRQGLISIGKFTGTANVNIPILNFTSRKLNIPISLGYSSNGVLVDELASTVGLGWNLNSGGVITRMIYDEPDETQRLSIPDTGIYSAEMLSFLGTATTSYLRDTQPDIYSFNFNGYSGVFYLDDNMDPVLLNPSPLKIEIYSSLDNEPTNTTPVFKVIDPQGIVYWFGGGNASEYTVDRTNSSGGCGTTHTPPSLPGQTAWCLTKITHHTGEEINLSYDRDSYRYYSGLNQIYTEQHQYNPIECTYRTVVDAQTSLLTEISATGFGKVQFVYSDGNENKKLDKISLYDEDNVKQKEFELKYTLYGTDLSYKNTDITIDPTDEKRLFLTELVESGRNGYLKQPYTFSYNSPDQLPPRLSYAQDFWGYFNGASTNTHLVSTTGYPQFSESLSSDRTANEVYGAKGILNKIIFPTGGYKEYFYESHRDSNNDKVGGVRVQKIISNERNGVDEVKTYYYNTLENFGSSSGIAINPQSALSYYEDDSGISYSLLSSTNFSLYLSHGYHIGYSSVIEGYGANFENGGIATKYDIQLPILPISMLNEYIPGSPNTNVFGNGNVLEEKVFKKVDAQFVILKELINTYGHDETLDKEMKVYNVRKRKEDLIEQVDNYCITKYFLKSQRHYLESSTQNNYDVNGLSPVTLTTNYYYDNDDHFQLTRKKTTDSKGIESMTKVIYPDDIIYKSSLSGLPQISDNQLSSINSLKKGGQHRISTPIQIETYEDDVLKTIQRVNYKNWKVNYKGTGDIIEQETYQVAKGTESLDDKIIYHDYSTWGNPLEISKENGIHVVNIWGYNNSQIIATISNAIYSNIFNFFNATVFPPEEGGSTTEQDLRDYFQNVRNILTGTQITSYTYDPLIGITSNTDPSGYTSFYEYDNFNRLLFIQNEDKEVLEGYQYNYALEDLTIGVVAAPSSVNAGDEIEITATINGGSGNFTYEWTVPGVSNLPNSNQITFEALSSHVPTVTATCVVTDVQSLKSLTFSKQVGVTQSFPALSVGNIIASDYTVSVGDVVNYSISVSGGSGSYNYKWTKSNMQQTVTLSNGTASSINATVVSDDCDEFEIQCEVTDMVTSEKVTRTDLMLIMFGCSGGLPK